MNSNKSVTKISWSQIESDATALARQLKENFKVPDRILAVTRGGLIPASLVARHLEIKKIETIGLESYHNKIQQSEVRCIKNANAEYMNNTLIIDDLVDSGRTFVHLQDLTKDCVFATLYAKPAGKPYTECFVREYSQDCWIEFPWETED